MAHKANFDMPPFENTDSWFSLWQKWKKLRNTCAECNSEKLELRNHDPIWLDGDLYCENGHFVRTFDAG